MKNLIAFTLFFTVSNLHAVDWHKDIIPILQNKCFKCHSEEAKKEKGKMTFDNEEKLASRIGTNPDDHAIIPGDPTKSSLVRLVSLDSEDPDVMPPDGQKMFTPDEIALLTQWVKDGAHVKESETVASTDMKESSDTPKPITTGLPDYNGMLSWTNFQGKTIQAQFIKYEPPFVVIRTADGTDHHYPLEQLNADSQKQAKDASQFAIPQ
jgi:hypothetical protein